MKQLKLFCLLIVFFLVLSSCAYALAHTETTITYKKTKYKKFTPEIKHITKTIASGKTKIQPMHYVGPLFLAGMNQTCTETDETAQYPDGINPFTRGWVIVSTLPNTRYLDSCTHDLDEDVWYLYETYCDGANAATETIVCEYGCKREDEMMGGSYYGACLEMPNTAPVVDDIPDVSYAKHDEPFYAFDLDDYVSDVEDPDSAISWTHEGGNGHISVYIDSQHRVYFSSIGIWKGSETITFTAHDEGGLTDSDDSMVTVTNEEPEIDFSAISPVDVQVGETFDLNLLEYSSDLETPLHDLVFEIVGERMYDSVLISCHLEGENYHIFACDSILSAGQAEYDIEVDDGDGGAAMDTLTINVEEAPVHDVEVQNLEIPYYVAINWDNELAVDVTNNGTQQETVDLTWTISGQSPTTDQFTLSAGQTLTRTHVWNPGSTGNYSIDASAVIVGYPDENPGDNSDSDNADARDSESDFSTTIGVGDAPPNAEFDVVGRVYNNSGVNLNGVEVTLEIDGVTILSDETQVVDIIAGSYEEVTWTVKSPIALGIYGMYVRAYNAINSGSGLEIVDDAFVFNVSYGPFCAVPEDPHFPIGTGIRNDSSYVLKNVELEVWVDPNGATLNEPATKVVDIPITTSYVVTWDSAVTSTEDTYLTSLDVSVGPTNKQTILEVYASCAKGGSPLPPQPPKYKKKVTKKSIISGLFNIYRNKKK